MSQLVLKRFSYAPTETEGSIEMPSGELATMERPWVPGDSLGGQNFVSCIPDGEYQCEYYQRSNGNDSIRLFNPDLGVYRTKGERPQGQGRWDCLIHVGNYVDDVVGCVAPGMTRTISRNRRMVASSRDAMRKIMTWWRASGFTSVLIQPNTGTQTKARF